MPKRNAGVGDVCSDREQGVADIDFYENHNLINHFNSN